VRKASNECEVCLNECWKDNWYQKLCMEMMKWIRDFVTLETSFRAFRHSEIDPPTGVSGLNTRYSRSCNKTYTQQTNKFAKLLLVVLRFFIIRSLEINDLAQ
jgi:hypothetical protein